MLVLSLLLNKNACLFTEMDVEAPWDNRKLFRRKKFLALPIILRSKPLWCLGVGYSNHTDIRNSWLEVEFEVEDRCARFKKKLNSNPDDASDHFLSAKRLHTRPTFGSNDRFLLLKPSHPSHGQTRSTEVEYLYLMMVEVWLLHRPNQMFVAINHQKISVPHLGYFCFAQTSSIVAGG